ncbi:Peptidase S54, rhomboid [Trema orientale]|uniref:Peptidase S54, rhomboid n=1 Tax=Trema orientale TaxID=63057 RepID=A0A2P5F6V9_TREOI|nr:Peptidase S54, rhomboid [Trema orientale]
MAVVPICYKMPYNKDLTLQIQCLTRQSQCERGFTCDNIKLVYGSRWFSSLSNDMIYRKWNSSYLRGPNSLRTRCDFENNLRSVLRFDSQMGFFCSSDSSANEKQLRSLSSYFGKLQDGKSLNPSETSNKATEIASTNQFSSKKELKILDAYLDKVDRDANSNKDRSTFEPEASSFDEHTTKEDSERRDEAKMRSYVSQGSRSTDHNGSKGSQMLQHDDETSDLYSISILASINIAVVLFEIASPVRSSDLELSSLPLLYGAKVNHLILVGEWWRLVTPMFLHCGIFDIGLGCWALITFGTKVCRGYGSFTFYLIYLLGGISGNLISFLHTPEPTVGGTAPIYAIIGAWLIYQLQNKDVIAKDVSESMFQKAMIITALGFILSHFGPIDEWAHFGAAFTGIAYGFLTCPTLQIGDAASRSGQEERIALVKRQAGPCKSLLLFSTFIVVLSSLLFLVEPPLNDLVLDNY